MTAHDVEVELILGELLSVLLFDGGVFVDEEDDDG